MIYEPNAYENAEYFEKYTEERIITLFRELLDKKEELEYTVRIDLLLMMLDHLGYKWSEYAEERRQDQYKLDAKREQKQRDKDI